MDAMISASTAGEQLREATWTLGVVLVSAAVTWWAVRRYWFHRNE